MGGRVEASAQGGSLRARRGRQVLASGGPVEGPAHTRAQESSLSKALTMARSSEVLGVRSLRVIAVLCESELPVTVPATRPEWLQVPDGRVGGPKVLPSGHKAHGSWGSAWDPVSATLHRRPSTSVLSVPGRARPFPP